MEKSKIPNRSAGGTDWLGSASPAIHVHFAYLLLLPATAVWILHETGWRVSGWIAFLAGIAIFVTLYLRAAILATMAEDKTPLEPNLIRWGLVVVLVGLSGLFNWKRWVVEQLLLEIAAFSVAVAAIAMRKALEEGGLRHGPWVMVLIVFVAPAFGLLWICLDALRYSAGESLPWFSVAPLVMGFVVAVYDAFRKLLPYTLGPGQLTEPFGGGVQLILIVIWFVALIVGVPLLLGKGSG